MPGIQGSMPGIQRSMPGIQRSIAGIDGSILRSLRSIGAGRSNGPSEPAVWATDYYCVDITGACGSPVRSDYAEVAVN
jgi:hypothetical protein